MQASLKNIRFSPEIEVEYPDDIVDTSTILDEEDSCDNCSNGNCEDCESEDTSHHYVKGWDITEDCSLCNGLEYKPSDNNYLFYNKKTLENIRNLLTTIKNNGGFVNKKCGLHIHINVENFSDKEITNIIKTFAVNQKKIISKFRVYSSRLGQYCHPLPDKLKYITIQNINEFRNYYRDNFWGGDKKYYALNIGCIYRNSYKTLEFRLFNGTLSYETMKKYIFWVLNFVIKAKDNKYETI